MVEPVNENKQDVNSEIEENQTVEVEIKNTETEISSEDSEI